MRNSGPPPSVKKNKEINKILQIIISTLNMLNFFSDVMSDRNKINLLLCAKHFKNHTFELRLPVITGHSYTSS